MLTTCSSHTCTFTTKRGDRELTKWRKLRHRFGASTVVCSNLGTTTIAAVKPEYFHGQQTTITIQEEPVALSWKEQHREWLTYASQL